MSRYNDQRKLVFFPHVRRALAEEIINHPKLMEVLGRNPIADFEEKLALISAYCGIAVDGEYTQKEVDTLCELCLKELKKRNVQILLPI